MKATFAGTGALALLAMVGLSTPAAADSVAAIEIESYLATHPAVKLAQVIGVPDERLQEVAAAFVELNPGANAVSEEELIDYCKGEIASFKVPRYVRFVQQWPMSSTKIQKFRLLDSFEP